LPRPPCPPLFPYTTLFRSDLTWLLHKDHVSWAYYVQSGVQPDCDDNPDETAAGCAPVAQGVGTPSIWNPLPSFSDVKQDGQLGEDRKSTRLNSSHVKISYA